MGAACDPHVAVYGSVMEASGFGVASMGDRSMPVRLVARLVDGVRGLGIATEGLGRQEDQFSCPSDPLHPPFIHSPAGDGSG